MVTIYSTPSCKYCVNAKDFFKEHSIEYAEHNVAEDKERLAEMLALTEGSRRVPVIVTQGDKMSVFIGFTENKAGLKEALNIT